MILHFPASCEEDDHCLVAGIIYPYSRISSSVGVVVAVVFGSIDYCLWLWVTLRLLKKLVLLYVVAYAAAWCLVFWYLSLSPTIVC